MLFCPKFYDTKSLEKLGDKHSVSDLGGLRSKEHIIAHELTHVDIWGIPNPIEDQTDDMFPNHGAAYGESRVHDYAWKNAQDGNGKGTVNALTALNGMSLYISPWQQASLLWVRRLLTGLAADTYAWYLTAYYFQKKNDWKWDPKGTGKDGWTTSATTNPPPPQYPIRTCGGGISGKMTYEDAKMAIDLICYSPDSGYLRGQQRVFGADDKGEYTQDVFETYDTESPRTLHVTAKWTGARDGCSPLDFKNNADAAGNVCKDILLYQIVDACPDYAKTGDRWKEGGAFDDGCMQWSFRIP